MKHGQQRLRAGAAQSLSDRVTTWLFLLPALAVVVVAVVIPLGNSFILSFQRVRILGAGELPTYVQRPVVHP